MAQQLVCFFAREPQERELLHFVVAAPGGPRLRGPGVRGAGDAAGRGLLQQQLERRTGFGGWPGGFGGLGVWGFGGLGVWGFGGLGVWGFGGLGVWGVWGFGGLGVWGFGGLGVWGFGGLGVWGFGGLGVWGFGGLGVWGFGGLGVWGFGGGGGGALWAGFGGGDLLPSGSVVIFFLGLSSGSWVSEGHCAGSNWSGRIAM